MLLMSTSRSIVLKKCFQIGESRLRAREPDWASVEIQLSTGPCAPWAGEIKSTTSSFHKCIGLVTTPDQPHLQQLPGRVRRKEGECGQGEKSLLHVWCQYNHAGPAESWARMAERCYDKAMGKGARSSMVTLLKFLIQERLFLHAAWRRCRELLDRKA